VASLPCYSEKNVSEQRGKGVFEQSIEALQKLNKLGYGIESTLTLNLAYNPNGAFLPPDQRQLEDEYKARLCADFGVVFNELYTITNMPISRFGAVLLAQGEYHQYMDLLKDNFLSSNLETLMCLTTVSVDWLGNLYDCDFNQMLAVPISSKQVPSVQRSLAQTLSEPKLAIDNRIASDSGRHLQDLLKVDLSGQPIAIGDHCYGCTAGQGSSCGGALE